MPSVCRFPLITLYGRAFPRAWRPPLFHAVGAPLGITTSLSKYVETAVRLANDPADYARYKALFTIAGLAADDRRHREFHIGIRRHMEPSGWHHPRLLTGRRSPFHWSI